MKLRWLMTCGVVLLVASTIHAGGWAVVTVQKLPDFVRAGEAVPLTYAVRAHGRALAGGLTGRIDVHRDGRRMSFAAVPSEDVGYYAAALRLPDAGTWTIAVDSGYGAHSIVRFPLTVVEHGRAAPPLSAAERGQRLFAAKGCIACHNHARVADARSVVGPPLTSKRYEAVWLGQKLANPIRFATPRPTNWPMPDLGLSGEEIDALVAFVNATT